MTFRKFPRLTTSAGASCEAKHTALLSELHLILSQVRPVSKLGGFVLGLLVFAVGRAHAFELHEDVEESGQVLLGSSRKLAFTLIGEIEKCAGNRSNLVSLAKCQ